MIPAFVNVTKDGYVLLRKILEQPDSVPADFFFDEPTVDGQIQLLIEARLVIMDEEYKLSVTELGRAALKEFESTLERESILEKRRQEELDSLRRLADSACRQAELAEEAAKRATEESAIARKDAIFSKCTSIIAIIISIIAIIAPIILSA